ncbi:MAG: phosphoribosylamine--glycine ligase, partial [Gammaproteobacteria bacterium]|nr:phosphoribosylamine--glycine ligase [Gammaproteobacteria bacterium]
GGYPASYEKGAVISGLMAEEADLKVFHAGTQQSDNGDILSNGGRVLCVTALGDSIGEAQQRAYQATQKISWKDSFYRKDIGWRAIAREQG